MIQSDVSMNCDTVAVIYQYVYVCECLFRICGY